MKKFALFCCFGFIFTLMFWFLAYIGMHICDNTEYVDLSTNDNSSKNIASNLMKSLSLNNSKILTIINLEEYHLTEYSFFNLIYSIADDPRFIDITEEKHFESKNLSMFENINDRIAQFLTVKYYGKGTVFYRNPSNQIFYNLTPVVADQHKYISCDSIKIVIENNFKPQNLTDEEKVKLINNSTSSEDVSCGRNVCFEFFTRGKLTLEVIKNCFDSNTEKILPIKQIKKDFFSFDNIYDGFNIRSTSYLASLYNRSFVEQLIYHQRGTGEFESDLFDKKCEELLNDFELILPVWKYQKFDNLNKFDDDMLSVISTNSTDNHTAELSKYVVHLRKLKKIDWIRDPCYKIIQKELFKKYYTECCDSVKKPSFTTIDEEILKNSFYCCNLTANAISYQFLDSLKSQNFEKNQKYDFFHCENPMSSNNASQCLNVYLGEKDEISLNIAEDEIIGYFRGPYKYKSAHKVGDFDDQNNSANWTHSTFRLCNVI
ncbi:hypothetical protein EDEG_02391 [Edhazardia aedis USNM 41457]|uniref:Uncharacterized protein n=1 Tax=Edhazardia aedis (strain USNM 41457) TaxID=1003232 RepID=J8ZU78_EDHAE|nr:hypothetical protein EDEG_02391 [Edhazardia aedis USNM 41457]|eukprot:EJW03223.1 hypothetical protein EDEG_02391 [Edhazardia aedis USNM 41457]